MLSSLMLLLLFFINFSINVIIVDYCSRDGVDCNNKGDCINEEYNFKCECEAEWTGDQCETCKYREPVRDM